MAGFAYDPQLYKSAIDEFDSICDSFDNLKGSLLDVSTYFPPEFEYKSEIKDICSGLGDISKFSEKYANNLHSTLGQLQKTFGDEPVEESSWFQDLKYAWVTTGAAWEQGIESIKEGKGTDDFYDALKQTGATLFVTYTTLRSGETKIVEGLEDGSIFLCSLPVIGVAKIYDVVADDDKGNMLFDATLDFIRRDRVQESNIGLYEHTKFGRNINELSNLKYDSNGAEALRNFSEFATKVAAATAAEIMTGGAATPIVLGVLCGTGKSLEENAQKVDRENGENYDRFKMVLRASQGALTGGLEWWGYGSLGSFAFGGGLKALGESAAVIKETGVKTFLSELIKPNNILNFGKNFVKELFAKENIFASGAVIYDNFLSYAMGDISKEDYLKSLRSEGYLSLAFAGFGASARSLANVSDSIKLIKETPVIKTEGSIHKFIFDNTEIDVPDSLFHLDDDGNALLKFLNKNNISVRGFQNGSFGKMLDNLDDIFRKHPTLSSVEIIPKEQLIWFKGLEPNSVYYIEGAGNTKFAIHTDKKGFGSCFSLGGENVLHPKVLDSIFGSGFTDVRYAGKIDDIYDFQKYYKSLFHNGTGAVGIDQGSLRKGMRKLNAEQKKKLVEIVVGNTGMPEVDAYKFLRNIDKTGVCSYAAALNTTLQGCGITKDKQLFKDCFGFDLVDPVTGRLNQEYLLADFYSYTNSNNMEMFKANNPRSKYPVRYRSFSRNKNQRYIFVHYDFGYKGNTPTYSDAYIVDYLNSRLQRGAAIHGDWVIKNYRPTLGGKMYVNEAKTDFRILRKYRNEHYQLNRAGDKEKIFTIHDAGNPLSSKLRNGEGVLCFYSTKYDPLPMHKLTRGSDIQYCGGPHAVSIVDDIGDAFLVESWGDIYRINKIDLDRHEYAINTIRFNN